MTRPHTLLANMALCAGLLLSPAAASGVGADVAESSSYCLDNTVGGFTTNIDGDCISDGNLTAP